MLSLDQCLSANRPIIFIVAESDFEVLTYLNENCKKDVLTVYSSTFLGLVPLGDLLKENFCKKGKGVSLTDTLIEIMAKKFPKTNTQFCKHIFLEAQTIMSDPQNIRYIKDIISRYQLDGEYTVNLIFISQSVIVPPALERLSEVVFFDLPSEEALKAKASTVYDRLEISPTPEEKAEISLNLKGLTLFETEQAILQSHGIYQKVELDFIRNFKKSAIAKSDLLELLEFGVTFDDIGGMDRLKAWINKSAGGWTVEGQRYGLPIMKGVLLVGPPGTGKSLVAKSIGNEWNLPVIQFDPSKLFSSRVGDSESNLRRVLKLIESVSPVVLFIDEMEKGMAGSQSSTFSDAGTTARVIGTFLTWFQDCTKPVFTIGTSNNISYLPPEMISRFDEVFFVNMPQGMERRDIFAIHLRKLKRDPEKFDLNKLAQNSDKFTGREISQVIKEALYDAYHEKKELNTDHILNVLAKKTSIIVTMSEQMKALYKWVGWSDEKKDGVRARYASIPNDLDITKIQSEIDSLLSDIENGKM